MAALSRACGCCRPAAAILQSTKLKEQEKTNKTLQKEKEQLQSEVRDLKARIKEGEWWK